MKVYESEALELLNIMAQGKVIYSYKSYKTRCKLRAYLVLPICFLLSPLILLSVFTVFMFMKAGFKHSRKAAFLSFVAVVMALRNKILIQENNKQEPVIVGFPYLGKDSNGDLKTMYHQVEMKK